MTNKKYRSYYKQIAQIMASHVDQQIQQLDTSQPVPISKENILRIEKISKKANSPFRYVHRISKAAAIVIICATITLSVTMGVEAIRTPILNFFTDLFGQIFHVSTDDVGLLDKYPKVIQEPCAPTYLPDGFVQTETNESATEILTTYQNEDNQTILFRQSIVYSITYEIPDGAEMLDDEFMVNGYEGRLYRYDNKQYAIWTALRYTFTIEFPSEFTAEEISKIANSVISKLEAAEQDKLKTSEDTSYENSESATTEDSSILQYLPEGYELVSASEGRIYSHYVFKNQNSKTLTFEIFIEDDASNQIVESSEQKTVFITDEIIGYLIEDKSSTILLWQDGTQIKRLKTNDASLSELLIQIAQNIITQ